MGLIDWTVYLNRKPKDRKVILSENPSEITASTLSERIRNELVNLAVMRSSVDVNKNDSSIARLCVRKVANSASSIPWVLQHRVNGEWQVVTDESSSVLRMLDAPNVQQPRSAFVIQAIQQIQRYGRCVIVALRDGGGDPSDLLIVPHGDYNVIHSDRDGVLYRVDWPRPMGTIVYPASDVIDWRIQSIDGGSDPEGPWQIAQEELEGDGLARSWQYESMKQRIIPDGIMSLPAGASKQQVDNVKEQLEARSGSKEARKVLVVAGDTEFKPLSTPAAEADFIETREFYRKQICAMFGVPSAVLGFTEDVTLANMDAAKVMFWEDTVLPYMIQLAGELEMFVNANFDGLYEVLPDVTNIEALKQRVVERAQAAQILHSMGVPFNRVDELLGIGVDAFKGDDISLVDASKLPLDVLDDPYDMEDL